jgi:hypothetical protein
MIRIAYLLPNRKLQAGARVKYLNLFRQLKGYEIQLIQSNYHVAIKKIKPHLCIVFGDKWNEWRISKENNIPYILCEHDVSTMRYDEINYIEGVKIQNAAGIIFTSPYHRDYVLKRYNIDESKTKLLYLKPSISDLNYAPLPKLEGKNIVYIGGLLSELNKSFSYRCYVKLFKEFIELGYNVHLYPIKGAPQIYSDIGCIYNETIPSGKDLYRALSQYDFGLQIFNKEGVPDKAYKYTQTCVPNKTFDYCASGIPTLGIHGGRAMDIYHNKWGIGKKDNESITSAISKLKGLNVDYYKNKNIIENYLDDLQLYFDTIIHNELNK